MMQSALLDVHQPIPGYSRTLTRIDEWIGSLMP